MFRTLRKAAHATIVPVTGQPCRGERCNHSSETEKVGASLSGFGQTGVVQAVHAQRPDGSARRRRPPFLQDCEDFTFSADLQFRARHDPLLGSPVDKRLRC
ncbi:hypothetical protein I5E68_19090 [Novosphingobium sp. YJ-S2-02]|uniref:Uncharacterized protein n=1 Tax=Novosphingobium aureum TaxID=2792964 RepID=A0A931HFW7_9SPHN|nr:hypothetical protein [Novosphingobium aureum]MBH0115054.1 hypothetical protein [Novosphingobium aureum]